ncbi:MAG: hypothetical protein ABFD61_03215 [Chloroherpetonaceae bacterium]
MNGYTIISTLSPRALYISTLSAVAGNSKLQVSKNGFGNMLNESLSFNFDGSTVSKGSPLTNNEVQLFSSLDVSQIVRLMVHVQMMPLIV